MPQWGQLTFNGNVPGNGTLLELDSTPILPFESCAFCEAEMHCRYGKALREHYIGTYYITETNIKAVDQ